MRAPTVLAPIRISNVLYEGPDGAVGETCCMRAPTVLWVQDVLYEGPDGAVGARRISKAG